MITPLEDYALLGDCRGSALVSKQGSIDWWCAPRFDSAACFAALLGTPDHGRWRIAPTEPVRRCSRRYQGDTLVLETLLETESGVVALIEFLLFSEEERPTQLVRVLEGRRGSVNLHMELILRFDFGQRIPWVTRDHGSLCAIAGAERVRLYTRVPTYGKDLRTLASFSVREGERASFTLTHSRSYEPEQSPLDAEAALLQTASNWRAWSAKATYKGAYEDAVKRSLLTLKALTFRPTGGIVAAPTASLPELPGGARNWDYRFCWIRDATIVLYALLAGGYVGEASEWRKWLLRATAGAPDQVQVIYGVAGERDLHERELAWLPGYADSRPVRIGNAAHTQLQLDVFGELMDAMYQCRHAGLEDHASWSLETALLTHLEKAWREPDEGIWEVRGVRRHFTHSKVMTWVAFDRAVRSIESFGREGPLERWRAFRSEIHQQVCALGYSSARGTFTQFYGSENMDASLLLMPLVGFLPADDPRIVRTVAAIEQDLLIDDTFVLRYRNQEHLDGLPPGEGAFLACSFWLVSNRIMQGRVDDARALFERLLDLRNDVGLLSEECDPRSQRLLGNFPQAFSHVALIDAAVSLSNVNEDPASHRTEPARSARGHKPPT